MAPSKPRALLRVATCISAKNRIQNHWSLKCLFREFSSLWCVRQNQHELKRSQLIPVDQCSFGLIFFEPLRHSLDDLYQSWAGNLVKDSHMYSPLNPCLLWLQVNMSYLHISKQQQKVLLTRFWILSSRFRHLKIKVIQSTLLTLKDFLKVGSSLIKCRIWWTVSKGR